MVDEQIVDNLIKDQSLSEDEQAYLKQILLEISDSGKSDSLNSLWAADYEEIPVSIQQFITDDEYLGKSLKTETGELTLFPYWIKHLEKIFKPENSITQDLLSGAIGIGKTTVAVVGLCYVLHKLLCLRNPAGFYGLNKGSKIALAFFNISIDQAYGVGYSRMQAYLKRSPWFLRHGKIYGRSYQTYYPDKDIEILVGSKSQHFIGRDIFGAMLDELNFAPGQNNEFEKSDILKLYNTVERRIESRFMKKGIIPGILFLISSKNEEYDFLEQYIQKNKNKPHVSLVDEPIWVVKSNMGLYSGKTFNVAVGNRYRKSMIIPDNEDPEFYEKLGQRVIKVPIEHYDAFDLDIKTALADIAGIAMLSSAKFFNTNKVLACYKSYLKNPFTMDEIVLGFDDDIQIKDYLIEELLPKMNRSKPHYIHWDVSKNHDRTGLSMLTPTNSKQVKRLYKGQVGTVTDVMSKVVLAIGIKNKLGEEIPFFKIRNFIYYLRSIGFNIVSISCDGYQSVDTIQQFKVQGFNAEILSVDRSRAPYESAKNSVNEGRLIMPKIPILEEEFFDVEDMKTKIDHTSNGSKDILDSVVANIFKISKTYAPPVNDKSADSFIAINNSVNDLDDFDDEWILPSGVTIINPM